MGRRKLGQSVEKYTILLPRELNVLVEKAIAATGETKAHFLRELIRAHVTELLNAPGPAGKRRLTLELGQGTALLLQRSAEAKGVSLQDMAQLILNESLAAYYQRGLKEAADRAAALEQSQARIAK